VSDDVRLKADVLAALEARKRELQHERDMLDARLEEVCELIQLTETPKRKPRTARPMFRPVTMVPAEQPTLEDVTS
jgi:hypothetical protein